MRKNSFNEILMFVTLPGPEIDLINHEAGCPDEILVSEIKKPIYKQTRNSIMNYGNVFQ